MCDFQYIGLFSIKKAIPDKMVAIHEGAEREVSSKSQKSAAANDSSRYDIVFQDQVQQVYDDSSTDEACDKYGAIDSD